MTYTTFVEVTVHRLTSPASAVPAPTGQTDSAELDAADLDLDTVFATTTTGTLLPPRPTTADGPPLPASTAATGAAHPDVRRGSASVSSPAGLGSSGHDRLTEGVPAGRTSSGWVRPRHVGPGDLVGALIKDAYEEGNTIHLSLKGREGRAFHVTVMSDPEGNGPGSLHISDSQILTFLGSLGGL